MFMLLFVSAICSKNTAVPFEWKWLELFLCGFFFFFTFFLIQYDDTIILC